jgi:hypothetical protein
MQSKLVVFAEPCPRCGKKATVTGRCAKLFVDQYFQPFGIRWLEHLFCRFGRATDVRTPEHYRACLTCGLVWNNLRPEALRQILEREGITVEDNEKGPELEW